MKTCSIIRLSILILTVCFVGSCGESILPGGVFYPPKPYPPRVQFLTALGDTDDVDADEYFISFSPEGEFDDIEMLKPYGMEFIGDQLYLCDTQIGGLWVLDLKDQVRRYFKLRDLNSITKKTGGKMVNMIFDRQGSKYIADIGRNILILYDREGRPVNHLSDIGRPVDVAVHKERVYILDRENHVVQIWNKNLTGPIGTIGKMGHGDGEFFIPNSIAVDDNGFIYVVDTGNARVQKFDQQGRFLLSIGHLGDSPGCFVRPKGIAIDRNGNIYVTDAMLQNVQLFDPQGELLLYFGQVPAKERDLTLPAQIILDYEHIDYFQEQVAPGFKLEYLILVSNQLGPNKVNVYGFGH